MIKLGVIFGGESVEHEVSIISAVQAMNKMDREKYEIIPIYISKDKQWYTGEILRDIETYQDLKLLKRYTKSVVLVSKNGRFVLQNKGFFKYEVREIDLAFPIVHGTNVEDGVLQGYLRTLGIPFVGSDVLASAIAQDKIAQKQIFTSAKLPVSSYVWFYDSEYLEDGEGILKKIKKLGFPVIVKPASLGSSVGIGIAKNEEEVKERIEDAISYDTRILVEEVISPLKEVNISVLGNYEHQKTSVIEEVIGSHELLTYEDKYVTGSKKGAKGMSSAHRQIPAKLGSEEEKTIKSVAVDAFKVLNCAGNVRIDFLVNSKNKKVYINEVNSCPGSLAFYLWDPQNIDYTELLDEMINIAIRDYKKRLTKTYSFDNNLLQGFSGIKGMKGLKGSKLK